MDCDISKKSVGFSLVELLVVIAVIAVLLGILLPSLSAARERAKRIICVSRIRQCTIGVGLYAQDFNGWLPKGNISESDNNEESWLDMNYQTCLTMHDDYGITEDFAICKSWEIDRDIFFYEPLGTAVDGFNFGATRIGLIYFGRRYDQPATNYSPMLENGEVYKSIRRISDGRRQTSSKTLFTCYHWDSISAAGPWGAKIPHVRSGGAEFYSQSLDELIPKPNGLVVGYLDGSAEWVKWSQLKWFQQASINRTYFSPEI